MSVAEILLDIAAPLPLAAAIAALWHLRDVRRHRCGCGHDLAFHAPETGECCTTRRQRSYGSFFVDRYQHVDCACRQYTGRRSQQERTLRSVA